MLPLRLNQLGKWRDVWRRGRGRGTYPHELAFLLLFPFRSLILSRRELVRRLHLTETSRVLELGPGPGFFSAQVASSLLRGHLCLVDVQREMLQKVRRRLARAGTTNVSFTQAEASALPFARDAFDVAFLVAVLGEVPDPRGCAGSLCNTLRTGGMLSVSELPGDPDAMPESEVRAIAEATGFDYVETFPILRGFTANFRKRSRP